MTKVNSRIVVVSRISVDGTPEINEINEVLKWMVEPVFYELFGEDTSWVVVDEHEHTSESLISTRDISRACLKLGWIHDQIGNNTNWAVCMHRVDPGHEHYQKSMLQVGYDSDKQLGFFVPKEDPSTTYYVVL